MRQLALLFAMLIATAVVAVGEVNADLLRAAREGDVETVQDLLNQHGPETLLASGADTELRDNNGGTPLMNVAATSHTSTLCLLLEWDADVDAVHAEGFTPLMIAAFSGRLDNVKVLLAAKPDIDVRDKQGRTADDDARERKREDIAEVIEDARKG